MFGGTRAREQVRISRQNMSVHTAGGTGKRVDIHERLETVMIAEKLRIIFGEDRRTVISKKGRARDRTLVSSRPAAVHYLSRVELTD